VEGETGWKPFRDRLCGAKPEGHVVIVKMNQLDLPLGQKEQQRRRRQVHAERLTQSLFSAEGGHQHGVATARRLALTVDAEDAVTRRSETLCEFVGNAARTAAGGIAA
jgi:hypothetical protein